MKQRMNKLFTLLLAAVMALGMSTTAFAADTSITFKGYTDKFTVQGTGEYTETDLFDNFKNVMPGDKLTQKVTIKNEATDCDYIKVYMQAVVHDEEKNPLTYDEAYENEDGKDQANITGQRDETLATMQSFLSQLKMRIYNGGDNTATKIYDASPDRGGMFDILGNPADKVLIATLRSGVSANLTVELDVPIEMGNEYANRVGEVDWIFTVEEFSDPYTPPPHEEEEYDNTMHTVRKIWADDGKERPSSIKVQLLKDGKPYGEAVELNDANQWSYVWSKLDKNSKWSVSEISVPDGYTSSVSVTGNTTTITNTKNDYEEEPSKETTQLTVNKKWSDDNDKNRPRAVNVTLYRGKTAVETVRLGEWNNWSYTWKDLDAGKHWQVMETSVPKGYVPSYEKSGDTVTVTNTAKLIQTGQLNWPIAVLGAAGLILLVCGAVLMRKRRNENA